MHGVNCLRTECVVCTGKYPAEVFVKTESRRSEVSVWGNLNEFMIIIFVLDGRS